MKISKTIEIERIASNSLMEFLSFKKRKLNQFKSALMMATSTSKDTVLDV